MKPTWAFSHLYLYQPYDTSKLSVGKALDECFLFVSACARKLFLESEQMSFVNQFIKLFFQSSKYEWWMLARMLVNLLHSHDPILF